MNPATSAPVPPPPDAVHVDEWEFVGDGPGAERFFSGTRRGTKVLIGTVGFQHSDGAERRQIMVDVPEGGGMTPLDAAEAREVIADLQAKVDELEALNG
jgi:hypothetical protein